MAWKNLSHIFSELLIVFDLSFYGQIISLVTLKNFLEKNVIFINQLFRDNQDLKHWKDFIREFYLNDNLLYKWLQRTHAKPRKLKNIINKKKKKKKNRY